MLACHILKASDYYPSKWSFNFLILIYIYIFMHHWICIYLYWRGRFNSWFNEPWWFSSDNWITIDSLVASSLFDAEPFTQPRTYCQLDLNNKLQWNFHKDYNKFISRKVSSAKLWPFCWVFNVLMLSHQSCCQNYSQEITCSYWFFSMHDYNQQHPIFSHGVICIPKL